MHGIHEDLFYFIGWYHFLLSIVLRKKGGEPTEQHLNPIKVIHQVEDLLDDNSILVADGGDFVGTAAYILR